MATLSLHASGAWVASVYDAKGDEHEMFGPDPLVAMSLLADALAEEIGKDG